jgi:hypothetical protein
MKPWKPPFITRSDAFLNPRPPIDSADEAKIETNTSKQAIANISTLRSFEAYTPAVDRPKDNIAKVKLFRHNQLVLDAAVDETFYQLMKRFGIREPRELRYGRGLKSTAWMCSDRR